MSPKYAAKAYVAAVIAFLTALTATWTGGDDGLQVHDVITAVIPALVAFGGVYWTPNETPPQPPRG